MDVREKLVDLIRNADYHPCVGAVRTIGSMFTTEFIEDIASQLITNGVTVQKWIPVADRLPDVGVEVLVYSEIVGICVDYYDGDLFGYSDVTHWMPLPEPPKGE